MDVTKALRLLYARREELVRIIAQLEKLQRQPDAFPDEHRKAQRSPRGRKFMSSEERQQVSARMKRYCAKKRGNEG